MAELHCLIVVAATIDVVVASRMQLYADDIIIYSTSPLFQSAISTFQPSSLYHSWPSFIIQLQEKLMCLLTIVMPFCSSSHYNEAYEVCYYLQHNFYKWNGRKQHVKYMKKSLARCEIVEVEIQRMPGPCCLVTKFSPAAVALCPEPFMFLLITQYLSRSLLNLRQDKGASEEH